jgi:uncharacterized protein with FMN-binding domain
MYRFIATSTILTMFALMMSNMNTVFAAPSNSKFPNVCVYYVNNQICKDGVVEYSGEGNCVQAANI